MKIALNMFSVRKSMEKDPDKTIEEIAKMGYNWIEIYPGYAEDGLTPLTNGLHNPNRGAKEEKAWLDSYGIKVFGTHFDDIILDDQFMCDAMLRYHAELGTENVGYRGGYFSGLEHLKRRCDVYNKTAKMCHDLGMRFHYHNHFCEFQKYEGKYIMDWIMEYTDPDLVDFELDTYWAMRGGADYVEMISRYPGRLCMIHQKDFPKNYPAPANLFNGIYDPSVVFVTPGMKEPNSSACLTAICFLAYDAYTEIGNGIMDIQKIIDEGNRVGCPGIMIEQDRSQLTELESARISIENLKKYRGIEA